MRRGSEAKYQTAPSETLCWKCCVLHFHHHRISDCSVSGGGLAVNQKSSLHASRSIIRQRQCVVQLVQLGRASSSITVANINHSPGLLGEFDNERLSYCQSSLKLVTDQFGQVNLYDCLVSDNQTTVYKLQTSDAGLISDHKPSLCTVRTLELSLTICKAHILQHWSCRSFSVQSVACWFWSVNCTCKQCGRFYQTTDFTKLLLFSINEA